MKNILLRLPDEIKDALVRVAQEEDRSINSTIIVAIKQYVKRLSNE